MKEILRLYGDKQGVEERIRELKPYLSDFYVLSRNLDTSVVFDDIDKDDFMDICDEFEDRIYNDEDVSMEKTLVTFLAANVLNMATAQSCTGG